MAAGSARPSLPSDPRCDRVRPLRVLFVGNSFTYFHNVPAMVHAIAESLPGPCIETGMIASGGATLEDHWKSDSVARRIQEGRWTHVVLNDQSSFGEVWYVEGKPRIGTSGRELAEFGGRFAEAIHRAGAMPVFLAHWADAKAPSRDQPALNYLVAKVARQTRSRVAPAGDAIKRMEVELPATTPYFTDEHHLAPAGAYLEALVLYATLTERSPVGAVQRIEGPAVELDAGTVHPDSMVTLVDLPEDQAARIQAIARATYEARRGNDVEPAPLSAELPKVPGPGDPVNRAALTGSWLGTSLVLLDPRGDPARIELELRGTAPPSGGGDTLRLQTGPIRFVGPATVEVRDRQVTIRATVNSRDPVRRSTQPLQIALQTVVRGDSLIGVATLKQPLVGTGARFTGVARFQARRVGPKG